MPFLPKGLPQNQNQQRRKSPRLRAHTAGVPPTDGEAFHLYVQRRVIVSDSLGLFVLFS